MLAIAAVALALAAPPAAPPSPGPVPPELAGPFTALIRRSAPFAGRADRTVEGLVTGLKAPAPRDWLWVVEFRWKERDQVRNGLAMIVDVSKASATDPRAVQDMPVRESQWAAAAVMDNKTLAQWTDEMQRARVSANEAAALGNLRTVVSAQAAFQGMAGDGFYADLACLAAPSACAPAYKGPHFLEPEFAAAQERNGYRYAFHPGAPKPGKESRLLQGWAMTAVPVDATTGRRAFCADQSGLLCAVEDGAMPAVAGAACPASCKPIQ